MKILAVGSLPPPTGGVSVFFSRWIDDKVRSGCVVNIFDIGEIKKLKFNNFFKFFRPVDLVFINYLRFFLILILKIFHLFSKIFVVDHNNSRYFSYDLFPVLIRRFVFSSNLDEKNDVLLVNSEKTREFFNQKTGDVLLVYAVLFALRAFALRAYGKLTG